MTSKLETAERARRDAEAKLGKVSTDETSKAQALNAKIETLVRLPGCDALPTALLCAICGVALLLARRRKRWSSSVSSRRD